ncbi:FtsK/SpoIIIE family DNA translocase [Alicyclobacillus pomorum]|jgi:DNA segregation ATPase FtsK/SpoIIIE, S-DNA-T family|uniref:FtsK/SpoIIIE family DNA translocase n=1 Tax=Alicyclobacillus pomorum TaxID=204470 RepID=UPI00040C0016|nr:DNA translocase FtsK [Alicyclobacillus pomorum]
MGKKKHQQNIFYYELIGLVILTVSILALGRLGVVGRNLDVIFIFLAGSWSFLVPIFTGYAGIYIMVKRTYFPWTSRHMGMLVLFVTWLTYIHQGFYSDIASYHTTSLFNATWNAIIELRNYVLNGQTSAGAAPPEAGGGLIGYVVFSVFHYLFAAVGVMVVLPVCAIIGLALFLEISVVAVVQRGTKWMEKRLEGLWKGSKQYVELLFGPDKKSDAEGKKDTKASNKRSRKPHKSNPLVVDGELVDETPASSDVEVHEPIVHDFTAKLRAKHAAELEKPVLEQSGNQITVRFPEKKSDVVDPPKREPKSEPYAVGAPVRDESYELPPVRMFKLPAAPNGRFSQKSVQENARKLEMTLESFGVQAKVLEISRGPAVTRYEVQPAVGVKVSRIVSLTDDIALALAARDIRIEAPVPGKPVVGIEVPNDEVAVVTLREVLESPDFQAEKSKLALALGRDISGAAIVGNLQKMPHLLVAGATGSGKSVCINGIIASILMKAKPHEVKFLMIDPKMVELSGYNGIPHLLAPVVTDPRKAAFALKKIVEEMESRYRQFADRGARDIERYNQLIQQDGLDPLPYIVVIVDELADLMMVAPGDVEDAICRIAQMARAAGIHLIVATQRPSVDVITGLIKANIPSRIAFAVSSMADSRTILDGGGAEKLLGRGDMLYMPVGASKPVRVQGAYVSEQEIEALVQYVKSQQNVVYTVDLNHVEEAAESATQHELDALFPDAVDLVVDTGQASVSMIQRRFRVGYSRAARIVDQMEQEGLVGPFEGSKPREVLINPLQWQEMKQKYVRQDG